jgi:nicotinamidase-related amidase
MERTVLTAASKIASLKRRARELSIPVVYANDNFGRWRSDFRAQLEHCTDKGGLARSVTSLLGPEDGDYYVLKAKLSGFYDTSLALLLEHLRTRTLVLCGFATDRCVLATGLDAHMREYELCVPLDCSAAETPSMHSQALAILERVARAKLDPSDAVDLTALKRED